MRITDLAPKIKPDDRDTLFALWDRRTLKQDQRQLFQIWQNYTGDDRWQKGCGKCRAEIMGRIGSLVHHLKNL